MSTTSDVKAQFFLVFGEEHNEFTSDISSDALVSFTLSTGTKLPSTIDGMALIMEKIERYFDWRNILLGETQPSCGDCECTNCNDLVDYCVSKNCLNYVSSIDKIECSNASCSKSNDIKYFIRPLFPLKESLPHYNPKFKFIKMFPETTFDIQVLKRALKFIGIDDMPPDIDEDKPEKINSTVMFSVSYPSLETFNTKEKFNEIYAICKWSSAILIMIGDDRYDRYVQHNEIMLQEIINRNNLPSSLLAQNAEQVGRDNIPVAEKHRLEMVERMKDAPPASDGDELRRIMDTIKNKDLFMKAALYAPVQNSTNIPFHINISPDGYDENSFAYVIDNTLSPDEQQPLNIMGVDGNNILQIVEDTTRENYEETVKLNDLYVPITAQVDTDPLVILSWAQKTSSHPPLRRHMKTSSHPPLHMKTSSLLSPKNKSGLSAKNIIIILFSICAAAIGCFIFYRFYSAKKRNKRP